MTDKQFERIRKGLQFHSEGGIDNLCTMTETTLRAILDDATKKLTDELTLTNNECKDMREELKQRIRENQKLCEQIEKMKNCKNCNKLNKEKDGLLVCTVGSFYTNVFGKNCDKWEIKEK